MDDKDWAILTLLDRERSISKLSAELFLSQPALTYRIHKIEKMFNSQLFVRSKAGLHPTPQGELLIKHAKQILKKIEEIREEIYALEGKIKGTIHLASSDAVATYLLPGLLSKFLLHYPDIELKVVTGFSSDMMKLLTTNEAHLAILRENIEWKHYKQLLLTEGIYLVSKSPIRLDNLPRLPRINYKTNPSLKSLINDWWGNKFQEPPNITMEVDNTSACKEMVKYGLGYAILPELCLIKERELFREKIVDHLGKPLQRQTWVYGSIEALNYVSVSTFSKFITEAVYDEQFNA